MRWHSIDSRRDPKNRLTETIGRPKVAAWPFPPASVSTECLRLSHVAQSGRESRSGPDGGCSENGASLKHLGSGEECPLVVAYFKCADPSSGLAITPRAQTNNPHELFLPA